MPQQINLMHAGLVRRREPWNSRHALLAVALAGLMLVGATLALRHLAHAAQAQALDAERQLAARRQHTAPVDAAARPSRAALELQRLRDIEAGQRQVQAAMASGSAGQTQGYAAYFMALSRQAQPALWITGFGVSADGAALELNGRMAEPTLLPDYLRRLNTEPLFKGRHFAQLSLKSVAADAPAAAGRLTEFALRSRASGGEGP